MTSEIKKTIKGLGLKPNETEYLKDLNMIRNRYSTGFLPPMDVPIFFEHTRKHIESLKKKIKQAELKNDLERFVFLHERPFRLEVFIEGYCSMDVTAKEIGKVLGLIWVDCENPHINLAVWKGLFKSYGKFCMDKSEQKSYDALPEKVEVYRGCEKANDGGISWTTDRGIANFFAERWNTNGQVITRIVDKSNIVAYFKYRGEHEVIILNKIS